MTKSIYLVNTNSTNGKSVLKLLKKINYDYIELSLDIPVKSLLMDKFDDGFNLFYICGGDGTLNRVFEGYMGLEKEYRDKIFFSIIPCGSANDLARQLDLPLCVKKCILNIPNNKVSIDIIKVNSRYFVTGGGIGIIEEVVNSLNNSKIYSPLNKLLKGTKYYFHLVKKIGFGYSGVYVSKIGSKMLNNTLMFLSVNNQPCIGKKFNLSPNSKNDDGVFEICGYPKPKNIIKSLDLSKKVVKGNHIWDDEVVLFESDNIDVLLDKEARFVGDGEILDYSNRFSLSIIPKAINLII